MNLSPDSNFMTSLVDELEEQSNKVLSDALNVAIEKGIIKVRSSSVVLVRDVAADKIKFCKSVTLDYEGLERIEELESANAALIKLNANLHNALSEFYEKTKENQWLKRS